MPFNVDAYVTGVVDLRTYQVSPVARGGGAGVITTEDLRIDEDRVDYVFGAVDAIVAEDAVGKRAGATMMSEGVTT
jgi:hypothetical protein